MFGLTQEIALTSTPPIAVALVSLGVGAALIVVGGRVALATAARDATPNHQVDAFAGH